MKQIRFEKSHDISKLQDELFAAIPALNPVLNDAGRLDPAGEVAREPVMWAHGLGNEIILTVPDDTDEAAIATVVAAHSG